MENVCVFLHKTKYNSRFLNSCSEVDRHYNNNEKKTSLYNIAYLNWTLIFKVSL